MHIFSLTNDCGVKAIAFRISDPGPLCMEGVNIFAAVSSQFVTETIKRRSRVIFPTTSYIFINCALLANKIILSKFWGFPHRIHHLLGGTQYYANPENSWPPGNLISAPKCNDSSDSAFRPDNGKVAPVAGFEPATSRSSVQRHSLWTIAMGVISFGLFLWETNRVYTARSSYPKIVLNRVCRNRSQLYSHALYDIYWPGEQLYRFAAIKTNWLAYILVRKQMHLPAFTNFNHSALNCCFTEISHSVSV